MHTARMLAVVALLAPTSAFALSIDAFNQSGAVFDGDVDLAAAFAPGPVPPEFGAGSLTQSLSPLVERTITLDDGTAGSGSFGNSLVIDSGDLTFNSGGGGTNATATVSYAFQTFLDVTAGSTGFSFGTGSVDGASVLRASLSVTDADGASQSTVQQDITSTPGSVLFGYADFTGVDLSRITSVTLNLQNTTFGTDGVIGTEFTADGGTIAPIPVPAGLPLLLAGLGALALLRRRSA